MKLERHEEHKQQSNVKHEEQRHGLGTHVKNAYQWTKRFGQTKRREKKHREGKCESQHNTLMIEPSK